MQEQVKQIGDVGVLGAAARRESRVGRVESREEKTEGKMPSARGEKTEGGMPLAREEGRFEGGMGLARKGRGLRGGVWGLAVVLVVGEVVLAGLVAVGLVYRTEWVGQRVLGWLAAAGAVLACGAGGVLVWALRRRWGQQGIWSSLEELAEEAEGSSVLGRLEAAAVGRGMSRAAAGWNRLIAAVDEMRDEVVQAGSGADMGGFLCSYDAQRLLGVLDSLGDGVMLADGTGQVVLANRACEGKLGVGLSGIIGRSLLEVFSLSIGSEVAVGTLHRFLEEGCGADCSFELVVGAVASKKELTTEAGAVSEEEETGPARKVGTATEAAQGGATILRVWCHRLGDGSDKSDLLLDLRDVTQQKLSEAARDSFIASVSHELRSPLTNIRAYAETLLSDMILDAAAQKDAFNVINEETERLLRLVNDILDLSRMETGSMALERGEVVLDRLIRQCVQDVRGLAAAKEITLETNYHAKLPSLCADREKLAVVFNNILTNAIKYTGQGGTVFVETNTDERSVLFKVTDTGYGIGPEDVERIFEKFYRVGREETAGIEGSGLGLAICREIVMLHGGAIQVSSELNKGTEMVVRLPLTQVGPVLGPAMKGAGSE